MNVEQRCVYSFHERETNKKDKKNKNEINRIKKNIYSLRLHILCV